MKPTPGPWKVDNRSKSELRVITDYPDETFIADLCLSGAPEDEIEQVRANARLIAAAPELLAALKQLVNDNLNQANCDIAEAAIAKAEGRS